MFHLLWLVAVVAEEMVFSVPEILAAAEQEADDTLAAAAAAETVTARQAFDSQE